MKTLNLYSKEQIDEKLSNIEATLPPSTVYDVNKALIVDINGEPKWTTIGSDGKIKLTFDTIDRFINYLSINNLNIGDTLYISCLGSIHAFDITAIVNATQIDISDNEDRTSFKIPCNGTLKYTWINDGEIQSSTEIIYGGTEEYEGGGTDGGVDIGDFNSAMYYSYSVNNGRINLTGVSTQEIWKMDIVRFRAVLITTG